MHRPTWVLLFALAASGCGFTGTVAVGSCTEGSCLDNEACVDGSCRRFCTSGEQCPGTQGCNLGLCSSCSADRQCANSYGCNVTNGQCAQSCANDNQCQADAFCLNGGCTQRMPIGDDCSVNTECLSNNCAEGQCCAAECEQGCNGRMCLFPNGEACQGSYDCISGVCAQGVCCNQACDDTCMACNQADQLGTCAPLQFAQTAECSITANGARMCDGFGVCQAPHILGDINPGGGPTRMLALSNGRVLFDAPHPEAGREVWGYDDGEVALLADTEPGLGSGFANPEWYLLADASRALLLSQDNVFGTSFWTTDGTPQGTGLASLELAEIDSPLATTAIDGVVYTSSNRFNRTWRTDGTAAGSFPMVGTNVASVFPDAGAGFVKSNNMILYLAKSGVVHGNVNRAINLFADAAPTAAHICTGAIHAITNLAQIGNAVYFGVSYKSGSVYDDRLWRYDPASVGTECAQLADIETIQRSYPTPALMGASDRFYFLGQPGVSNPFGLYMWRTGTITPVDVTNGSVKLEQVWQDRLYFRAGSPERLYVHNGQGAPQHALGAANPIAGGVGQLHTSNQWMYVVVDDPSIGGEIWRTRGSGSGLQVENLDLWPGTSSSGPLFLTTFDGYAFVAASTPANGRELIRWQETGAAHVVIDLAPGEASSHPSAATAAGTQMVFAALKDADRYWIWTMSSATATPVARALVGYGDASSVRVASMVNLHDGIAFCADDGAFGHELWVSDASGNRRVRDLGAGLKNGCWVGESQALVSAGTWLLFAGNDDVHGVEPFVSDGTLNGTTLLKDIHPAGDGFLGGGMALGTNIVFIANNGTSTEVWVTNGTSIGTLALTSLGANASPKLLAASSTDVFFVATTTSFGRELYATGGTPETTRRISDFGTGPADGLDASPAATLSDDIFYIAVPASDQCEIYRSGGTPLVTELASYVDMDCTLVRDLFVQDQAIIMLAEDHLCRMNWASTNPHPECTLELEPGSNLASPSFLGALDGSGLFAWQVQEVGREVWVANGTLSGTTLLQDFLPGSASSAQNAVGSNFANRVFFAVTSDSPNTLWSTKGAINNTWQACIGKDLCRDVLGISNLNQRIGLFFNNGHGVEPGVFP